MTLTGPSSSQSHSRSLTRARGGRWPWAIVAIAVVGVKVESYAALVHHRGGLIFVLAIGLVLSVLRPKPVAIAAFAAGVLAFAVAPHPWTLGAVLGFGSFALLIALFFAISTVLHARAPRQARRRPA